MLAAGPAIFAPKRSSWAFRGRDVLIFIFILISILGVLELSPAPPSKWRVSGSTTYNPEQQQQQQQPTQVPSIQSSTLLKDATPEDSRIAKVSIMYGDAKPEYEQALTTHKHHNRLHGYKMLIQREPMLEGYWTKPAFLMSIILQELRKPQHERLQWLFWVDADTIILNYEMPIEAFLPPWQDDDLKDISIVVTNDFNGFNNGVFAIKVDVLAAELFAGILAFRDFEPDTYLQWHDQSAMHNVLKQRKFAKHTVYVPQRWFNAYKSDEGGELQEDHVRPGDFLVHFAGVADRESVMREWLTLSEKRLSEWNVRLSNTHYPGEIERFWAKFKEEKAVRDKEEEEELKRKEQEKKKQEEEDQKNKDKEEKQGQ